MIWLNIFLERRVKNIFENLPHPLKMKFQKGRQNLDKLFSHYVRYYYCSSVSRELAFSRD